MPQRMRIRPPGDKSVPQRALLFAALAGGESTVRLPLISEDTNSMVGALQTLGVEVVRKDGSVVIEGKGKNGLRAPLEKIDCGNSGTTARLLIGALAGHPFDSCLIGDESLSRRPMRRVTGPLMLMDGRFTEEAGDGLPLIIHGGQLVKLSGYHSPHSSAQVKTALILAGYTGGVSVGLSEPIPSRDHTERMFRALGQDLQTSPGGEMKFMPNLDLPPFELTVPGDLSSAANTEENRNG